MAARLLNRAEAQEYLSVGKGTFDGLRRSGELPCVRLPGRTAKRTVVRYDREALDRLVLKFSQHNKG